MDIVTVFHKASSPASSRVANLVKQISANAQEGATLDQASDNSGQIGAKRDPFELNITEDAPTSEQVQTILDYVGRAGVGRVIKGAHNEKEALQKFKESRENFLRPVVSVAPAGVVSWHHQSLTTCNSRLSTGITARPSLATTRAKS